MKTSILSLFALTISAALAIPVQAGGNGHGGGGGIGFSSGGGGHTSSAAHVASPSFRASPGAGFRGGRFMAPAPGFPSYHAPMAFRQQRFVASDRAFARSHQFATETAKRRFDAPRTLNHRGSRLARNGNNSGNRFENRGSNTARAHLFAQRSANWHRDWDRHHDHWWHGHRCRFVDGSWFIYDIGFDPYDYWYPYEDYAYAYNPYEYNAGVYEGGGADYYDQGAYDSSDQSTDSTVAAVQEQLAKQGYYRGELDGVFGPETRRAVIHYQSDHGLGVTGHLNMDTLHALGVATSGE
jgi:hypothetical protein